MLGYARVSTGDQSLDLQLDVLAAAGVPAAATWTDIASGARAVRPGLDALLAAALPGDAVVVWRLDRLRRSLAHLAAMSADLAGRGITVRSLTDGVDTTGSTGVSGGENARLNGACLPGWRRLAGWRDGGGGVSAQDPGTSGNADTLGIVGRLR